MGMVVCFPRLAPPPRRLASASGMVRKETVIRANKKERKVFKLDSSSVASVGRARGQDMGVVLDWGKAAPADRFLPAFPNGEPEVFRPDGFFGQVPRELATTKVPEAQRVPGQG